MKTSLITLLFFAISTTLFSQSITGVVTDENQKPIQEVSILNSTTQQHTHTNANGKFVFQNVSTGDTLQFSHISFKSITVVVASLKNPITVVLQNNVIALNEVLISPTINSLNVLTDIDIQTNPVSSSQDILRTVPGLFIGQHAGGGKAEQLFLRGFDIDHGTDVAITVDGLPVNMVSHAHGQGYADLHFVIPETMDKVDFGKGPYYQNKGNFNTAGYVNFMTKNSLENSSIKLEAGQFDTFRMLGMFNVLKSNSQNAYVATEYVASDGPFESPQHFNRINIFGKYTGYTPNNDKIGVTLSHFTSGWDASGQIPQRSVDNGTISRFGAIDDTEGGHTSRTNLLFNYNKNIDEKTTLKNSAYVSQYNFELYSNFTFFLENPIEGDQIRQKETRTLMGVQSDYKKEFSTATFSGNWQAGIGLRNDQSNDNELSKTANRKETLEQVKFGAINETNLSGYFGATINTGKWTINPAVRTDYFNFQYQDNLQQQYQTQAASQAIVSPKLNILYTPSPEVQLFVKTGKGFHSNDTRVVVTQQTRETLPAAYGFDVGYVWKPSSNMFLSMAYWHLYLAQEFVYVGDAGIVEPSGKTTRQGIDLSYRYQPTSWLFWNIDANYTHARATEEPAAENFIPLAPDFTLTSGLNVIHKSGVYGGLQVRHLDDRPANEDNSIVAKGYTIADLNLGYTYKNMRFGVQIQNILDSEWNETQFATTSQLQNEIAPVEEIHFTPGTPFFLKTMVTYTF